MIENGKKVKFHYVLTVDGERVDGSPEDAPLEYEHGKSQIIPGLERAMAGLKVGEEKQVIVGPDDGYGPINPQAVVQIERNQIESEQLEVGMGLRAVDQNGRNLQGIIREFDDQKVTVDFNHPLAGKELHFSVTIIEII